MSGEVAAAAGFAGSAPQRPGRREVLHVALQERPAPHGGLRCATASQRSASVRAFAQVQLGPEAGRRTRALHARTHARSIRPVHIRPGPRTGLSPNPVRCRRRRSPSFRTPLAGVHQLLTTPFLGRPVCGSVPVHLRHWWQDRNRGGGEPRPSAGTINAGGGGRHFAAVLPASRASTKPALAAVVSRATTKAVLIQRAHTIRVSQARTRLYAAPLPQRSHVDASCLTCAPSRGRCSCCGAHGRRRPPIWRAPCGHVPRGDGLLAPAAPRIRREGRHLCQDGAGGALAARAGRAGRRALRQLGGRRGAAGPLHGALHARRLWRAAAGEGSHGPDQGAASRAPRRLRACAPARAAAPRPERAGAPLRPAPRRRGPAHAARP
jgi:hypothetical protein